MKVIKMLAVVCLSFISISAIAQEKKIEELKNPTIKAFLAELDGTEAAAEKAVAKYCSPEVIADGMIPMGKIIRIASEEGNCVDFHSRWIYDEEDVSDEEAQFVIYTVCEENGKIVMFDIAFGDDEEE